MVQEQGRQDGRRVHGLARRVLVLVGLALAGVVTGHLVVLLLDQPVPEVVPQSQRQTHAAARPAPWPGPRSGSSSGSSRDGAPSVGSVRRATTVLHAWDADRAAAYARGDPAGLRRLYVPGSRAGLQDLRVLRAYAERGLVVRGLRTQVLAVRVLSARDDRLRLEVTDRLVGGRAVTRAVGRASGVGLPRDAPTARVLVLRQDGGAWRMRSVQPA